MKGNSPWLRRSTALGLAAGLFWLGAIAYPVYRYMDGDPRFLLRLGSMWEHPAALHGVALEGDVGYDGQFYAALATDPLLLRPGAARFFDAPAYRASRAGLPLVAWVLAAGDDERAVFVYQALCWILGALLVWAVARWLEDRGAAPWWAALLALTAGVVSSMYSSLPDAAAASLMVLGLWLHGRGAFRGSVGILAAASLVKETTLIASGAAAWAEWRAGRRGRAVLSIAAPAGLVIAWRLWILSRLGAENLRVTGNNFGWPLAWLPEKLAAGLDAQEGLAVAGLLVALAAAALVVPAARAADTAATSLVGFALLGLFLNRWVYVPSWWNYTRVLLPLSVLLVIAAGGARGWRRWSLAAAAIPWSVVGGLMLPRLALASAAAVLAAATWDHRRRRARAVPEPPA